MNVAERRTREICESSPVRTHAQSRSHVWCLQCSDPSYLEMKISYFPQSCVRIRRPNTGGTSPLLTAIDIHRPARRVPALVTNLRCRAMNHPTTHPRTTTSRG